MTAASLNGTGDRILVPNADPSAMRSVPTARWDKRHLMWSCKATPAVADNLQSAGFTVSPDVKALADSMKPGDTTDTTQPALRTFDLWDHQVAAYHYAKDMPAAMLDIYMGRGKSKVAISILLYRNLHNTIIICPKSVMGVWRREFMKHSPVACNILVLDGKQSTAKKSKMVEEHCKQFGKNIVVANYEAVRAKGFKPRLKFDGVLCDEVHRIKDGRTATNKAVCKLSEGAKLKLGLTGTIMPHSPMDVFGQFKFLDPGLFGEGYVAFRSEYAITGHFGANHIVGYRNQDKMAKIISKITYHAGKEGMNLPPVQHIEIPVQLGGKTRKAYNDLKKELIHVVWGLQSADDDKVRSVTASNALVLMTRLSQLTSGYTVDDDDNLIVFGKEKYDALYDLIEGIDKNECVVVFCRFRHDLSGIREIAKKLGRQYGEVSGSQNDLDQHSQIPQGMQVMGVQIRSGGVGVDFTRAQYGIYLNHPWSRGEYDQSISRISRHGQKNPVTFYHLNAEDTVDHRILASLEKSKNVTDSIIDMMLESAA